MLLFILLGGKKHQHFAAKIFVFNSIFATNIPKILTASSVRTKHPRKITKQKVIHNHISHSISNSGCAQLYSQFVKANGD